MHNFFCFQMTKILIPPTGLTNLISLFISPYIFQSFEHLMEQEAKSLAWHYREQDNASFDPECRITGNACHRPVLASSRQFLFHFQVVPIMQDTVVQQFQLFTLRNRRKRILFQPPQMQGYQSEQQTAEPFGMKRTQHHSHLIPIQGCLPQHHCHITNLLQSYSIRQEVTLDMQNQTNEIHLLVIRLCFPAPLLEPSIGPWVIQVLPMTVKLHQQLVLLFQYHFILITPVRIPTFPCQENFQLAPSVSNDYIDIPRTPVQRFRIPSSHRCPLEYRSRQAGTGQFFHPCLSPSGNVPVGLFQIEQMRHPLVPQVVIGPHIFLGHTVYEQSRYRLTMCHAEQMFPYLLRKRPFLAYLLLLLPQPHSDIAEEKAMHLIARQFHVSA